MRVFLITVISEEQNQDVHLSYSGTKVSVREGGGVAAADLVVLASTLGGTVVAP